MQNSAGHSNTRYRAHSTDEYIALIDEAIFELQEMIQCVELDIDDELADLSPVLQQIVDYLIPLKQKVAQQEHAFGTSDLEYIPLVRKLKAVLPFHRLLEDINRIHRQGLD